jgi:hypothetical protein
MAGMRHVMTFGRDGQPAKGYTLKSSKTGFLKTLFFFLYLKV